MKKYIIPFIVLMTAMSLASCKKYLKEQLVSQLTQDYYNTDQGLEDLVRSCYTPLRYKFEGEQAYALFNFGTDEFIEGDQFNFEYYNSFGPSLNPGETLINGLWNNNYFAIGRCNLANELLPPFKSSTSKTLGTAAQITQRVAEVRFLRAYYYFQLVQEYGGVPLVLHAAKDKETDFPRSSVADVYKQIITDMRYAEQNLAPTASEQGRITKGAADHFLAKVYLTRGSAVTEARGQQPTDIDSTIYYANLVINSGNYALETDYMNLWNGVYPNGYPKVATPDIGKNGSPILGDYSK